VARHQQEDAGREQLALGEGVAAVLGQGQLAQQIGSRVGSAIG
jgi:hypothetical protein